LTRGKRSILLTYLQSASAWWKPTADGAAENRRLGYIKKDPFRGMKHLPATPNSRQPENDPPMASTPDGEAFIAAPPATSAEPTPVGLSAEKALSWFDCNEVTQKLAKSRDGTAAGWAMLIEGEGWFGQVRDERGHWSFGPSTLNQTRDAVEAWLRHEPFDKCDDERMCRGDCARLVTLPVADADVAKSEPRQEQIADRRHSKRRPQGQTMRNPFPGETVGCLRGSPAKSPQFAELAARLAAIAEERAAQRARPW
jgi:hypothetical protein